MLEKRTLWKFSTLSKSDNRTLTEVCRSYDLRRLVEAIQISWSSQGRVTINYGEGDDPSTVFVIPPGGEPEEIGYIVPDRFFLLMRADHL